MLPALRVRALFSCEGSVGTAHQRRGLRVSLSWVFLCLWLGALAGFAPDVAQAQSSTAQGQTTPDYTTWDSLATQAQATIGAAQTSDSALDALRGSLVDWRAQFLAAQDVNAARISTLEAQISALGPAPAEGASEADDIAARRKDLNAQLEEAQAPVLTAEEAYTRADGLVREIDSTLRSRQADALLTAGPSPLNPSSWATGFGDILSTLQLTVSEVGDARVALKTRLSATSSFAAIAFYIFIGLVLVLRGRQWMEGLTARITRHAKGAPGQGLTRFVASLSQVIVPVLGIVAFTQAIDQTGLLGARGQIFLHALPELGFFVFVARWLGLLLFPRQTDDAGVVSAFDVSQERRREARAHMVICGVVLVLLSLIGALAQFEDYAEATRALLVFPVVLVAGVNLSRMGAILRLAARHMSQTDAAEIQSQDLRDVILGTIGRLVVLAGIAAPVLSLAGYQNAAIGLTVPVIETLGILGLLVVLSHLVIDLFAVIAKSEETARASLGPVLVTFVLVIGAIPVLALVWGARPADLLEIWTRLREGFAIGDVRITPTSFFTFAVIFAIGYGLTKLVKVALATTVLPKTKLDKGGQHAITVGTGYVGIFLAAMAAITTAGINLSSLAIVAGALSVGVGFGLQTIVSNFVSGIILLIERPISEGDWIEAGGQMGFVRDISVRATRVETFDRTDVIIPNQDLIAGQVVNYTRGNLIGRAVIPVGVAYGSDTRRVDKILHDIAAEQPMVLLNPSPQVFFTGFGADSMDFEIRVILRDVTFIMQVKNDINHAIAERFAAEGIEIPFAQRDIWLRNPEALTQGARPAPAAAAHTPKADPVSRRDAVGGLEPGDVSGGASDGDTQ
ncbi:Mechanosensitive channel MscK precursor [Aquimixticola soesokkakensis]|uniref:Mechanosensitive channel MscK n=1 Tax=Aquimixticola soesokkakensis TaxID=1519096 RepID=A0A1Y5STT0_9RHOB|nr:DUF3772 domain-containing protein [Aquimixticola soesokkakensis]SLN46767.1 Mechanosensitive channel MscK precursor [Aquimixticola soesokkakensis]